MNTIKSGVKTLLVSPSVGYAQDAKGYWFDKKFVEGMRLFQELWAGPLTSVMRKVEKSSLPFGEYYTPEDLPFSLVPLGDKSELSKSDAKKAAVVLASGDNHDQLRFCLDGNNGRPPVCYVLEHDQVTRYKLVWFNGRPLFARIKSLVWTWLTERRRGRAVFQAEGMQANGVPAMSRYSPHHENALLFFDTRMKNDMFATPVEMAQKADRLRSGAPLRLVFSGRLEKIKGVDHLPRVAAALKKHGIKFTLDIFGTGSLEVKLREAISRLGLMQYVRLCGVFDFETTLVPHIRQHADLFLCCHRQADPSCTYLETYGCGVPIIGYRNAAFEGVRSLSNAGWSTRMNAPDLMAQTIAALDADRETIIRHAETALAFAQEHSFEKTFGRRISQLKGLALQDACAKQSLS